MSKPRLIGRVPRATPSGTQLSGGRSRGIPDDLLQEASNRLAISAQMGVVLWTVGAVLDHLAVRALRPPGDPYWRQLHVPDAIAAFGILTSLAFYAYSRRPNRSPRVMLDLGLVYLVLTSLDIGLLWHWRPDWTVQPVFTWVGTLVLTFAAIIPNPPMKTFIASLIAVSMMPLGMLVARARGVWQPNSAADVLLMHYPDYIMVGVAVVISHVVTRLGQQVTKAREMGSYHLGELLGKGGMGEVYRATHRMLARPAAIKLIRQETVGATEAAVAQLALKRFRREAEVAASLRSPHTVELYDFGVTEDQTLYFVMELLEGMDLDLLVKNYGPLPANRVIHILSQVCESLEEAHVRGLVHRDIKPPNIHVGRLGLRHDFVKVLDFGLVKPLSEDGEGHSLETGAGLVAGTPSYMAPEVAMGKGLDARSDLYAVGCVAYYLLTGRVVFEANTVVEALVRHVNDPPIPPSARINRPIPPALEQLVLALLAKRPEDRPESAAALARSLAAIEVEPWGETEAAEWWRQNVT